VGQVGNRGGLSIRLPLSSENLLAPLAVVCGLPPCGQPILAAAGFKPAFSRREDSRPVRRAALLLTRNIGGRRRGGPFAGVQMVPVVDRVERQEERPLRLPAPEGTQREEHDVTFAKRNIHGQGAAG